MDANKIMGWVLQIVNGVKKIKSICKYIRYYKEKLIKL